MSVRKSTAVIFAIMMFFSVLYAGVVRNASTDNAHLETQAQDKRAFFRKN